MNDLDLEKRVSDYIDALNAEYEPEERHGAADTPEMEKLLATVRMIRTLREPALPAQGYPERLAKIVADKLPKNRRIEQKPAMMPGKSRRSWIWPPVAALVAGCFYSQCYPAGQVCLKMMWFMPWRSGCAIGYYHGILEMRSNSGRRRMAGQAGRALVGRQ